MEAFYSDSVIDFLKTLGFTYFHGIDERTSVFFNKETGKFISCETIQNELEGLDLATENPAGQTLK